MPKSDKSKLPALPRSYGGFSRRRLSQRDHSPIRALEEYMMPMHQMPTASPEPERLADETSVKTIHTKVNNKLDPAVPVSTCRRS